MAAISKRQRNFAIFWWSVHYLKVFSIFSSLQFTTVIPEISPLGKEMKIFTKKRINLRKWTSYACLPFSLSFQIFLLASLSFFLPLFWTIFSSISSFTFELPNVGDCLPWWVTQPPQVIYLDQKLPVLNKNNRVQPNSTNSEHHF